MFPINLFNILKRHIRGKTTIKQLKHKTKHTKFEDITHVCFDGHNQALFTYIYQIQK